MIKKYKSKPKIIEAVQFDGSNHKEIYNFISNNGERKHHYATGDFDCCNVAIYLDNIVLQRGDSLIRKSDKFYPVKPDIFEESYEEADE